VSFAHDAIAACDEFSRFSATAQRLPTSLTSSSTPSAATRLGILFDSEGKDV